MDKNFIYETITSVKPPYDPFKKYVKFSNLTEILAEAWENEDS
jgi:hypothetical protein